MLRVIKKWMLIRRLRKQEIQKSNIGDSVFLEKARLWMAEANMIPGTQKPMKDVIETLMAAEHICHKCKYLDGTCLFGLDAGVDKVVNCAEFEETTHARN
jgi:hypothetical protein